MIGTVTMWQKIMYNNCGRFMQFRAIIYCSFIFVNSRFPDLCVLTCASCPVRPVLASCPACPVLWVLPCATCPVSPALCVLSYASCCARPVLRVLSCASCRARPVLFVLSCPACPARPVLSGLSCPACPAYLSCLYLPLSKKWTCLLSILCGLSF